MYCNWNPLKQIDKVLEKKTFTVSLVLDVFFPLVWKKTYIKNQKAQNLKLDRCTKNHNA